jgi:flagellar motor switch protein FliG
LEREHPQTIALVLAHLPPECAGHVLAHLAARVQTDVIRRLVEFDATDPHVLVEVEHAMIARLESQRLAHHSAAGVAAVAAILHASQPAARRQILNNLAAHDRTLAHRFSPPVPTRRFTFSEVCQLPLESLVCLVHAADRRTAVLALAGASPELVDELLECLRAEEADWFARRLTNLGPLRLADIDQAQEDIAALASHLIGEGRLNGYTDSHLTAVV